MPRFFFFNLQHGQEVQDSIRLANHLFCLVPAGLIFEIQYINQHTVHHSSRGHFKDLSIISPRFVPRFFFGIIYSMNSKFKTQSTSQTNSWQTSLRMETFKQIIMKNERNRPDGIRSHKSRTKGVFIVLHCTINRQCGCLDASDTACIAHVYSTLPLVGVGKARRTKIGPSGSLNRQHLLLKL